MSSTERIRTHLRERFENDEIWHGLIPRVIFWLDPDKSFEEVFSQLNLPNVRCETRTGNNEWALKLLLAQASPEARILIYQPQPSPAPEQDWLLDAKLYGQVFSAERVQMLLLELGLSNPELQTVVQNHLDFFKSQERQKKLIQADLAPQASAQELQVAMMAVLLNLRHPEPALVLRALLAGGLDPEHNPAWQSLMRFFKPEDCFALAQIELGIEPPPVSLMQLALMLAITHLAHHFHGALPSHWRKYLLSPTLRAFRFVDSWLHDSRDAHAWQKITDTLAQELDLNAFLQELKPESYWDCETFPQFDQAILIGVRDALLLQHPDFEALQTLLQKRKTGGYFEQYQTHYQALNAGLRLIKTCSELAWKNLKNENLATLFEHYRTHAWQIDQAYRHYWAASDRLHDQELLKPLHSCIDGLYLQFLEKWGELWGDQQVAQASWPPSALKSQTRFFEDYAWKRSHQGETRLVVIVSDALRYEVAQELQESLQAELAGNCQLEAVCGVLPSRTHFGMSALLPRAKGQSLKIDGQGLLNIGGERTEGTEQRAKLLAQAVKVPTAVFKFNDLQDLNREAGRQLFKDLKLAYIYHDQIDATGDKPANQDKVFAACETAIEDLTLLIKRLVNWNIPQVIITADHGFLYQRYAPESQDKLEAPTQPTLLLKHRCALSTEPSSNPGILSLALQEYQYASPLYVQIPRGAQRFRLQGGSTRYMHGGSMPQEICVPVLCYQHIKAGLGKTRPKTGVQVISSHKRITNNVFALHLFQTDAVGENIRARSVRVFFETEEGHPLTNEKSLELAHESQHAPDREIRIQMTILARQIQPGMKAFLRVIDAEDQHDLVPLEPWILNLGFVNDFGI